ncbi:MAG: peptidoglycan editing factor PgeF [Pseudomonadota bacterium]
MSVDVFTPRGWPRSVRIVQTDRRDGASESPYDGFNLGAHVGDAEARVRANRAALYAEIPRVDVAWLAQEHGTQVVNARRDADEPPVADACWTREAALACAILSADCLPVLIADRDGTTVAAAHAGWRGLAGGVLEATVRAMGIAPSQLLAWLGPAIGPESFEVGPEVREHFLATMPDAVSLEACNACFAARQNRDRYLADLPRLARLRLEALGLGAVDGDRACTFENAELFYSYRRDGRTGRMASLIFRVDS